MVVGITCRFLIFHECRLIRSRDTVTVVIGRFDGNVIVEADSDRRRVRVYRCRDVGAVLCRKCIIANHEKTQRPIREHERQPKIRWRLIDTTDSDFIDEVPCFIESDLQCCNSALGY